MAYINLPSRKKIRHIFDTFKLHVPYIFVTLFIALLSKSLIERNFPPKSTDPIEPRPLGNLRHVTRNGTDPTHIYHGDGTINETCTIFDHRSSYFCVPFALTDYISHSCFNHTYYNWMINDAPPMFLHQVCLMCIPFIPADYKLNSSYTLKYCNLMIHDPHSKFLRRGCKSFVLPCSILPSENIKVEVNYNKALSNIISLNIHAHNCATYRSTLFLDKFMLSKDMVRVNAKKLGYAHKHPILHKKNHIISKDKVVIKDKDRLLHDISILYHKKPTSSKSPGNVIHPYKFLLLIPIILMFASTSRGLAAAPISGQALNKFKVIHALNAVGQQVLLKVYQQTKSFDDSKSIKDHLINDLSWTEKKYKTKFDKTQLKTINDTDPSGKDYDISLLVKCQRVLSEINEPDPISQSKWNNDLELEGRCKKLKDKRNEAFHSISGISNADMITEIDTIENMVTDIIISLEGRFPHNIRDLTKFKKDIKKEIKDICKHNLGESYQITILSENARLLLIKEKPQYKDRCKEWGNMQVLDFLLGCSICHEVKLLFTEVIVEKSNKRQPNTPINYTDILKIAPGVSILLINSVAGGGKTTIFRFGINNWGEGGNVMNTASYDFIFPMVFRDSQIRSIEKLIMRLMPNLTSKVDMEYIMMQIKDPSQRILFFCDGFDEKNAHSLQLFNQICDLAKHYPHIQVVVTSRPESVREFYHVFGNDHIVEQLQIRGIHESHRCDFLRKYHDNFISTGLSVQNTDDLLRFYSNCNARHKELYRLPINLVILAWLWGQDSDVAKMINSAAGLYNAIVNNLDKKLRNRLMRPQTGVMNNLNHDIDRLNDIIDEFKELMYKESFLAVRYNRIYIDDSGVKKLRRFCGKNNIPFLEMKGAYLLAKIEWENDDDLIETLEFPHKEFNDFYCAKQIVSILQHLVKSGRENLIKKVILDSYGSDSKNVDLSKYQNVVILLAGIIGLKDGNLVEAHGQDIVDLLIETGVKNNTQWFATFMDMNVNPTIGAKFANLIEPHLNHTINESDIEIISTFLKYVDMSPVTLAISGTAMPTGFPSLIKQLATKQVEVSFPEITDRQVQLWNTVIMQNNDLNIKAVTLAISGTAMPTGFPSLIKQLATKQVEVSIPKITNDQIQLWNTVIMQNNDLKVKAVTLDISTTVIPAELPSLIHAFREKECNVTIPEISDVHVDLWNSNNMSFAKINTKVIDIKNSCHTLPFLSHVKVDKLRFTYLWRDISNTPTPDMTGCDVKQLWTAIDSTDQLPSTLIRLCLALKEQKVTEASVEPTVSKASKEPVVNEAFVDPGLTRRESGTSIRTCQDPGIGQLLTRCPQLERLGIHIRAGAATGHLPKIPAIFYTDLFLSDLEATEHIEWAVKTAKQLQPSDGYSYLVLPRCYLQPCGLQQLVQRLGTEGVRVRGAVRGSGPHIRQGTTKERELEDVTNNALNCCFFWYDNEEKLEKWYW